MTAVKSSTFSARDPQHSSSVSRDGSKAANHRTTMPLPHLIRSDVHARAAGAQRLFVYFMMVLAIGGSMMILTASNILPHSNGQTFQTALKQSIEEFKITSRKMSLTQSPKSTSKSTPTDPAPYSHLSCSTFGGPADEFAQEMVYWKDIESDRHYISPFKLQQQKQQNQQGSQVQYMTFEPDGGGWNNIRMAMETVLGLAIAMGRVLVLPPSQKLYLLAKQVRGKDQKIHFGFADFFPMEELAHDNDGLSILTMQEFLERVAMTGNLRHKDTNEVSFPPGNRTDWEGISSADYTVLKEYLRNVTVTPLWSPGHCLAAFPASGNANADSMKALQEMQQTIHGEGHALRSYIFDDPIPIDATPFERMKENLADRRDLCIYDEKMQQAPVVHFMCYHKMRVRMLVHFYAFLYFEDWREDLWMKRFMRDHVRYIDEIQCAAARIVHTMRKYAISKTGNDNFDTFHVRRGDFQYKSTRISAEEIYDNTKDVLTPGAILYIATDERDKSFFEPLKQHYDIKFMDDFMDQLHEVNTNYFGMIDQLVASRGRLFFGCWHSTFTGFINRMRGYHSVNHKLPGYEKGELNSSYYYVPLDQRQAMHKYNALHGAFFNREFPTSWRDLDKGIGQLPNVNQ